MTSIEKLIAALDRYDALLHKHIAEDISERNDPELEEAALFLNMAISEAKKEEAEPNDPLTLEELRGMDGEPVWLKIADGRWGLVDADCDEVTLSSSASIEFEKLIGRTYRRPPDGGDQPAQEEE